MRIAFFGSSQFSCHVLAKLLASSHEVAVIVTQPDQRAGRSMKLCPTVICSDAGESDIPILKPESTRNNPEFRRELKSYGPDAFVTASYGQIISKKTLALTYWPLNVHPSDLPKLRGASPIRSALLQGLRETACCVMKMTPRLDDGDIVIKQFQPIEKGWDHDAMVDVLGALGGELAVRALDSIADGSVELQPQDHEAATYTRLYNREDTYVDWALSSDELCNFVRAWCPDIGACTKLSDGRRLKLWRVTTDHPPEGAEVSNHMEPGLIAAVTKKHFWVATGDGLVKVMELQLENKGRMPTASFLAGTKAKVGERLG